MRNKAPGTADLAENIKDAHKIFEILPAKQLEIFATFSPRLYITWRIQLPKSFHKV